MNFERNICMTNEVKPISQLNCNHLFHSDSIDKWLKQSETCPYCREEFDDFNDIEKLKSDCKKIRIRMHEQKKRKTIINRRKTIINQQNNTFEK